MSNIKDPNWKEKLIEELAEAVHKAYCAQYEKIHKEPYWTGKNYTQLSEQAKEYERVTVRAVLNTLRKKGLTVYV